MGVYIKGMKMPTKGYRLILIYADGTVQTTDGETTAAPVPEHGRLIDAEPIMKFITDGLNSGEFGYDQIKVLTEIQYAPTIIPAEPPKEET